jgi:hypothetical protein
VKNLGKRADCGHGDDDRVVVTDLDFDRACVA